jgi:hypothetical protein
MFARTQRLTLRPAWPEDAPALAQAIDHEVVARMLMRVPFPYSIDDAAEFDARARATHEPRFLIFSHHEPELALVGGIALTDHGEESGVELSYWLTPAAWGRSRACRDRHGPSRAAVASPVGLAFRRQPRLGRGAAQAWVPVHRAGAGQDLGRPPRTGSGDRLCARSR